MVYTIPVSELCAKKSCKHRLGVHTIVGICSKCKCRDYKSPKTKILRQGLNVSINELKELADSLFKEGMELEEKLRIDSKLLKRKWIVPIINKQPKCSDTWVIEK